VTEIVVKKRSKVGPVLWSLAAVGLVARTFYRPHRAVMNQGYAVECAGDRACGPALVVQAASGSSEIYAVTSGKVAVSKDGISIISDREPIVVSYGPGAQSIFVQTGQEVGLGQALGLMSRSAFSVTEVMRDGKGGVSFRPIEPASWLAARGLRVASSGAQPSALWCSHGRRITVPRAILSCGVRLPEPSSAMLLPVSVTTE
jgi:murein DD-endopeptidase MepM/ murein hydrolase activator NlpD